jgi:hypothetical protein
MLGRLSPSIPDALLGVAIMRPCQFPGGRSDRAVGARALLLRLLADALSQADLGPRMRRKAPRTGPGRATPAQVVVARRWLLGELDDQVAIPCRWLCDVLGIESDVLAAAVRARVTTPVVAHPQPTSVPDLVAVGTRRRA